MFSSSAALDRSRHDAAFARATAPYHATENWFDGSPASVEARIAHCAKLMGAARAALARFGPADGYDYITALSALEDDRVALVAMRDDLLNGYANRDTSVQHTAGGLAPDVDPEIGGEPPTQAVPQPGPAYYHEPFSPLDVNPWISHHLPEMTTDPATDSASYGPNPLGPVSRGQFGPFIGRSTSRLGDADRRTITLEARKFVSEHPDCRDVNEMATRAQNFIGMKISHYSPERFHAMSKAFVSEVTDLARRRTASIRVAARPPRFRDITTVDPAAMFL